MKRRKTEEGHIRTPQETIEHMNASESQERRKSISTEEKPQETIEFFTALRDELLQEIADLTAQIRIEDSRATEDGPMEDNDNAVIFLPNSTESAEEGSNFRLEDWISEPTQTPDDRRSLYGEESDL